MQIRVLLPQLCGYIGRYATRAEKVGICTLGHLTLGKVSVRIRKDSGKAYERIVREATTTLDFVPSVPLYFGGGA